MTLSITYSVHCNQCSAWTAETDSAKDARNEAKREGWRHVRVPNGSYWDFCPRCYAAYEEGNTMVKNGMPPLGETR